LPSDHNEEEIGRIPFSDETCPFREVDGLDVATVEVDRLLSLDENNLMRFSVSKTPRSLGLLPATSLDDYNSVNYMRACAGAAKTMRLFAYRLFGMPKPVSDWRNGQQPPAAR
jgi:hypothetical protein